MEILYKRNGSKGYLILPIKELDEKDYKFQMVVNNKIEGLVSLDVKSINNNMNIYYDVTSLASIKEIYLKKKMNGNDIYELIKAIVKLSEKMREYLLDINNIIFDMENIFFDKQTKTYKFCYYPNNTTEIQDGVRKLFDEVLEYINHNDKKAVLIAYGVQQETISDGYTITDLLHCAEKNIRDEEIKNRVLSQKPIMERMDNNLASNKNDEKKGLLFNFLNIFKKSRNYKDEEELHLENDYSNKIIYADSLCESTGWDEDKIEEDATVLLRETGFGNAITLRGTDMENPIFISPNMFPCVIGKSEISSDYIVNIPVISRVHMRIIEEATGYYIEDLNSTNGTFVNGERVKPHELKEINVGDVISLANIEFAVE